MSLSKASTLKLAALIISFVVIVVGVIVYLQYSIWHPSTDDAYVNANVVQITPQVSGEIKALAVENLQAVKKGQLLFEIDPAQYQDSVNQAQAQWQLQQAQVLADEEAVRVAQAQLTQSQANRFVAQQKADRTLALVKQGLASPEEGDEVQGTLNVDNAAVKASEEQILQSQQDLEVQKMQVKSAYAALMQAQLNVQWTKVYSPVDGYVDNLSLRPGMVVQAQQSQFAIVDNSQWWVDANYKEGDMQHIKTGQTATIHIDMYPGHPFTGTVAFLSSGSGSTFSLLPPENATGNWVKITQRFPVKILIPNSEIGANFPLRVGASATVRINAQ